MDVVYSIRIKNHTTKGVSIIKSIIAILNLKGGIGKSTTAKTMAYIMGKDYGLRVLLCDLDSSGNLSSSLYHNSENGAVRCKPVNPCDDFGMPKILMDKDADIRENILETTFENVSIIPSNDTMQVADSSIRIDTTVPQQYRLMRHLKKVYADYDYIILDCPPAQDMSVVNALYCAREVIIPTTINQDSLEAIPRVSRLIDEIQDYNPALSIRGVLFTRIARNTSLDKQGVKDMRGILTCPVFDTYIRNSIAVERCRFANMSLREYDSRCTPAIDYDNFVAEYLGKVKPHPEVVYTE